MNFLTYAAGGILLGAFLGALTNQHYSWFALGVAIIGSWLPHFCDRPWLHSLLGLICCAILTSPLFFYHQSIFWTTLLIGILAHLLIDAGSDRGVLLFYPSRVRAVIPRHPLSRVIPGSPRETLLRHWLIGFLIIAIPLNAIGLRGILHQVLPVIQFAVEDDGIYAAQGHRVFVDFTGRFTASQRSVSGRWEVLETIDRTTLLAQDDQGHLYTLGTHPHDTIQVLRIRAGKGPLVDAHLQTIHLHEQLLGDVIPFIPSDGRTYLIGQVKTPVALQPHINVEQFQAVQVGHGQVELRYATVRDLQDPRLLGLYVTEGEIVLRTLKDIESRPFVLRPSKDNSRSCFSAKGGSASGGDISTNGSNATVAPNHAITLMVHHIAGSQEILVHEGQTIHAGQPLADLRVYRAELLADLRIAQAQVIAADALIVSLQLKQMQDRSLKMTEDALMGTHRDLTVWQSTEDQTLAHAQAQAVAVHAKLAKLKQSLAATTIRAPAPGRFLSVEFHQATSTATLYLRAND